MRHIIIILSILLMSSLVFGASLNLKATWTPNTETDMAGYNLYRTDGTRIKLNTTLIPHPTALYLFTTNVPDNTDWTLTFVLTAVDTANNESLDSVTIPFLSNLKSPVAPVGGSVTKQ